MCERGYHRSHGFAIRAASYLRRSRSPHVRAPRVLRANEGEDSGRHENHTWCEAIAHLGTDRLDVTVRQLRVARRPVVGGDVAEEQNRAARTQRLELRFGRFG